MRIVVQEWERVLRYRGGRFVDELGPGAHWALPVAGRRVRLDMRPHLVTLASQEVLTGDRIPVKLSLLVRRAITQPRQWHETLQNPDAFVYGAVQIALREAVAARTLEELLASRSQLGAELVVAVADKAAQVGAVVEEIAVRDFMVPAELRRAAAEAAVARAQGGAALERARAEVAATRALANAARLMADNPGIAHLRTLQAVETGRATVVLTTGAPGAPVPGAVSPG